MKFILATNNPHKLEEMQRILRPQGIEVFTPCQLGVDLGNVEETGSTFEENAEIKAMAAFRATGFPSISDDSGLMVDALDGQPGIYSARYSGENANSEKNIQKLLDNMKDVPEGKRGAKFVCTMCCIISEDDKISVRGECKGTIAFEKNGLSGFGYDPIFITESGKAFAQLSSEEKDKISHRGNAMKAFLAELNKRLSK